METSEVEQESTIFLLALSAEWPNLTGLYGRQPTPREMALALGITPQEVELRIRWCLASRPDDWRELWESL
jgi:hypothetical protein